MSFSSGKNLQNNVNTTEAQTLSNKTMDSTTVIESGADIQTPAIIDPSRADVKKDTLSNLQTYASTASNGQLCYATDSKKMFQVLDGALAEVGGGAGGINYITNPDAEVNADGWNNYANTTPGVLPDDFLGSVSGSWSTIAASPSSPLRGSKSFIFGGINSGAGDLQGHGVYSSFTVDSADLAKKMTISFDYLIDDSALTNAVDGMLRVYIYDEDKSQLIRVNGEDLQLNANSGTHYAQFQTDSVSTNYRLVIHQALALISTEDYEIRMDNVKVGPTVIAKGTIVTDWDFSNTVILKGSTTDPTKGTIVDDQIAYRRVGDSAEFKISLRQSSAGTAGSGTYYIELPDGLQFDDEVFSSTTYISDVVGHGIISTTGGIELDIRYQARSTNRLYIQIVENSGSTTQYFYNAWSSSKYSMANNPLTITGTLSGVKIKGWSSNAKMSEDLGGREVVVEAQPSSSQSVPTGVSTVLDYGSTIKDTTNSWNGSTFTAPEKGIYTVFASQRIALNGQFNGTSERLFISASRNGGATQSDVYRLEMSMPQTTTSELYPSGSTTVDLEKGDTLEIAALQESGGNVTFSNGSIGKVVITKLASPQTILETETVAARYTSNAGTNISPSTYQILKYEDIDFDTHSMYDTSTGILTIPTTGKYNISSKAMLSGLNADQGEMSLAIYVNGTRLDESYNYIGRGSLESRQVVTTLDLIKGDEVTIRLYQTNGAGRVQFNQNTYNTFSIVRAK